MAATRLTRTMRKKIQNALMRRAYVKQKEEIANLEHELGMTVYDNKYSQENQALMRKLPAEFWERSKHIYASFAGDFYRLTLQELVPLGNQHYRHWTALDYYPEDHELTEAFRKFKKLKEEYEHDCQRLSAEAYGIMAACSTVKKLIETWPEIEPVLQELNISPVQIKEVHLPAVRQDMNDLFRLSPEDSCEPGDNQALAA